MSDDVCRCDEEELSTMDPETGVTEHYGRHCPFNENAEPDEDEQ